MHRVTRIVAGAVIIWLGLILCSDAYVSLALPPEGVRRIQPPNIQAIRELSDLIVLEVHASEIVGGEVRGRIGATSAIVLVHGAVMLGVELEQAHFIEVDRDRCRLVLALPAPTVRRVAIDHHASRTIHCGRDGLWHLAVGPAAEDQAVANAFTNGLERLTEVAVSEDLTRQAKQHAQAVLGRFADETGWTLEVRWND